MRIAALLLLSLTAAVDDYKKQPGPHAVATIETLTLKHDGKDLPLRVTYPKEPGTYPVVVFSHGLYGSKDGYVPLATFWAAHGYVCIQPTHPDSLKNGLQPRRQATRAWNVRPKQVSFILDSLDGIGKRLGEVVPDQARVAVGGHSFGAHTAQLIGGARARGRSFADARVKCVLLISPQGRSPLFAEDAWKTLTKPALVITGSKDTSMDGNAPEWRLDPYRLSPPGDRYLVWIDGAYHGFGGISGARWRGAGPRNDEHVRIVRQTSLAFFDAFVKGDAKAKQWLREGKVADGARCENRVSTGSSAPADRPARAR